MQTSAGAKQGAMPEKLFMAAAAAVRVESVGEGVMRVSWLVRIGHEVPFFSPPDFVSPGLCAALTRSTQFWRAFPPPRPVPMTSPGRMPMRSHACFHETDVTKGFVKMSLHWPGVGW
jgi:hypothetical protein